MLTWAHRIISPHIRLQRTLSQAATLSQVASLSSTPSASASPIALQQYSGTNGTVDPCGHRLAGLYPFGPAAGDSADASLGSSSYASISWAGPPIVFYGQNASSLYPTGNGLIGVGTPPASPNVSSSFPSTSIGAAIAPWWSTVGVDYSGGCIFVFL